MTIIQQSESIQRPLNESNLDKKSLCDYVVNPATGCIHKCTFCYVTSTPVIRNRVDALKERGVSDPFMDWGDYLFPRTELPLRLGEQVPKMRKWKTTAAGRGVVLLSSTTDPYQTPEIAAITRQAVQILLAQGKRIRILTRSPLWVKDLDILVNPNVIVGMSLPMLDDALSRQIELRSPLPSHRLKALRQGKKAGCRLFLAMAPTPPMMGLEDFLTYFEVVMELDPEVVFWEPINCRGVNGERMIKAGLTWARSFMDQRQWSDNFQRQWDELNQATEQAGCLDRFHPWPDMGLSKFMDTDLLQSWWYRPTVERWEGLEISSQPSAF